MKKTSKTMQSSGTNTPPKIVFFGSGPVATKSIELLSKDFEVEAIITKPTTLKDIQTADIPEDTRVYSVGSKAELDTLIQTTQFESSVAILIDFGIIVSQTVIDSFEFGIINSHFSLLPELRGADPITFSILSGQKRTGVSLMRLVEAMDEGPIIACGVYELTGAESTPELTHGLIHLSDTLLKKEIPRFLSGETQAVDQSEMPALIPDYPSTPSYSRKLTKTDGVLDFSKPAITLEREIRAFSGWPKSRTTIVGKDVIILGAHVNTSLHGNPGDVYRTDDKQLAIHTTQGTIVVDLLQPAGKKPMSAEAFIAGYGKDLPILS